MDDTLPRHDAAIYLAPLREGGSLPAVVEATDGSAWVVKFRGAGQGPRALIAEVVVAELAEAVGLPVPARAVVTLDASFGLGERDPEIRDILKASRGPNIGLRYMDAAFNLDPVAVPESVDERFATTLVWFDALVSNPDRSPRNPNLMLWQGRTWLIDHGAALYFHHDWSRVTPERMQAPLQTIGDHILLSRAGDLEVADAKLASRVTSEVLERALARVPDELLLDPMIAEPDVTDAGTLRNRYRDALLTRLETPRAFVREAEALRRAAAASKPVRLESRR